MKPVPALRRGWLVLMVCLGTLPGSAFAAPTNEPHRATFLGNPATRFAPPLRTTDDLRARFRDERLKPDFASVLRQYRWPGDPEDMHRAAATAEITEAPIAIGAVMPFMSTRKNGHPICLINVRWEGKEPAPAYAFHFTSRGRRYRCVTPKACSNFFVEDLGPEPRPVLALECSAPPEIFLGRPVEVCLTVRNTGDAPEPGVRVSLGLPASTTARSATGSGVISGGRVQWTLANLATGATQRLCAMLLPGEPGTMRLDFEAAGTLARPAQAGCSTKVAGVPAILLETVDLADPVEVGREVTYEIKVTNQGTAVGTRIRLVCTLPSSQEFVSISGTTDAVVDGLRIVLEPLDVLEPKAMASWLVTVKALKEDDARFKVELVSDQFTQPITEEEPTQQY